LINPIRGAVKKPLDILIADRNPRVRSFLKRELEAEGYRVRLAETGHEMLDLVFEQVPLDLLILDPDLPDTDSRSLLKKVRDRIPPLPVIIHTFLSDCPDVVKAIPAEAFVEKGANSVEDLKHIILTLDLNRQSKRG
jgi:DNA-binding NtrC family response regulator